MTAHPRIVPVSYHQRTIRCNTNIHRTKPLVVLSIQENKPFRSETRTFRNDRISQYGIFSGFSMDKLPPIPGRKQCSFVNTSSGWRTGTVQKQVRYYAWVILMPMAERDRILPVNPPLSPPGTAQRSEEHTSELQSLMR